MNVQKFHDFKVVQKGDWSHNGPTNLEVWIPRGISLGANLNPPSKTPSSKKRVMSSPRNPGGSGESNQKQPCGTFTTMTTSPSSSAASTPRQRLRRAQTITRTSSIPSTRYTTIRTKFFARTHRPFGPQPPNPPRCRMLLEGQCS